VQEMAIATASAHWTNFFFSFFGLVVGAALYVEADFGFDFDWDCVSMMISVGR